LIHQCSPPRALLWDAEQTEGVVAGNLHSGDANAGCVNRKRNQVFPARTLEFPQALGTRGQCVSLCLWWPAV